MLVLLWGLGLISQDKGDVLNRLMVIVLFRAFVGVPRITVAGLNALAAIPDARTGRNDAQVSDVDASGMLHENRY